MESPTTEIVARICWKGVQNARFFKMPMENQDGRMEGSTWEWDHSQIIHAHEEPVNCQVGSKNTPGKERFVFDRVYGPGCSNTEFYTHAVRERSCRMHSSERNLTILAHGQSNAGRSHTLFGSDSSPGLISWVLAELFRETPHRKICLGATDIEQETMYDLLSPGRIETKTLHSALSHVPTMHDAHVLMHAIEDRRSKSCSSHCIVTLTITQGVNRQLETRKITFVDFGGIESSRSCLPGSDDLSSPAKSEPKNSNSVNMEDANTRRAMLALTKCIKARSHPKSQIVSYRESKLTSILRENLADDDFLIICAIDAAVFKESLHTLRFASSFRHKSDSLKHSSCDNATMKLGKEDLVDGQRGLSEKEAMKELSREKTMKGPFEGISREADSARSASIGGMYRSRTPPLLRGCTRQLDSNHDYSALHHRISEDLVSHEMSRAEMLKRRIDDGLELMQSLNNEISAANQAALASQQNICRLEKTKEELLTRKSTLQREVRNLHDETARQPHYREELASLYKTLRELLGKK